MIERSALPTRSWLQRLDGTRWVIGAIVAVAVGAFWLGGLRASDLVPNENGLGILRRFAGAAWRPALEYEDGAPPDAAPLLLQTLGAMRRTLVFALAAMAISLVLALPLGFLASWSFWRVSDSRFGPVRATLVVVVRTILVGLRSIHELLWAVLFLAAFGLNPATAALAIALPYAGGLAKVFSEMLDEAPHATALALEDAGATRLQAFVFGLFPRALPDMAAYAFYRFECAVRASAVLGFFGFPTLGYHLKQAFDNVHFRETWTYLYALLALVLTLEWWSGRLRKRILE